MLQYCSGTFFSGYRNGGMPFLTFLICAHTNMYILCFFSKKNILIPNVDEKKYSDFGGGKKNNLSAMQNIKILYSFFKKSFSSAPQP
jgi:hypothetical protein